MPNTIIGFDAKRLFNNFTGLGNYSRTLVENLRRYAPDNTYILYSEKIRSNENTAPFTDTSKYRTVTKSGIRKFLWRIFSIRRNIAEDNVQIFHGLSHDLPFGAKPKDVKYVVTVHDVCFKTFPEMFARTERMIYTFKYSNALRKADRVIAISESTKNDIIRYYPDISPNKIDVVYQALNHVYYDIQSIDKEREIVVQHGIVGDYILYVGSINSRKNLLGVVRAYKHLSENKRLPLVVIGNGRAYKDKVMSFAHEENLEQYIHYLDNVSLPEHLRAFYRCATMLVYPSFYEGFGLPVAEALLCETPVITSSISSLPEAGGEYALYVDPDSDRQIAQAITRLIDDKPLARKLGQKGREFVAHNLNPEKLTLQMADIYTQLTRNE